LNKASPKLRENLASRLVNSESKLNSDQYGKFVSINVGLSIFKRSKEQWLGSFDKQKKTKELFRYVHKLFGCLIIIMIHYLENKVGVVGFANAQGMVMF
jgi:hypothetical protein